MADPSETTQVSRYPAEPEAQDLLGAVRTLTAEVESLQSELQLLRERSRSLPSGDLDRPGWEEGQPGPSDGAAWVRTVDTPGSRRIAVPWLLLEILFLVAVAVLAAVAGLDAPVVVGVMVVAWLLVAAAEWFVARADRRAYEIAYGPAPPTKTLPDDPMWFEGPPDDTTLEVTSTTRPASQLPPPAVD